MTLICLLAFFLGTSAAISAPPEYEEFTLVTHARLSRQPSAPKRFAPAKLTIGAKLRFQGRRLPFPRPPDDLSQVELQLRHVRFERKGLPQCPLRALQSATAEQAQARCGNAEVGKGSFTWPIRCRGTECRATAIPREQLKAATPMDELVAFNGRSHGRNPEIYVHATDYEGRADFVLGFAVLAGRRGSQLVADASPSNRPAYSIWPADSIIGMELTLGRRYRVHGKGRVYLSASCSKRSGEFPLGQVDFRYASGTVLAGALMTECGE